MERLAERTRDVCLDKAYISREMCDTIKDKHGVPFIAIKSNTITNAKGSRAWKEMVTMAKNNPKEFDSRYHQRSIVEAVFAAIKTMYGNSLRTRTPSNQGKEMALRVILYNIELMYRYKINRNEITRSEIEQVVCH